MSTNFGTVSTGGTWFPNSPPPCWCANTSGPGAPCPEHGPFEAATTDRNARAGIENGESV